MAPGQFAAFTSAYRLFERLCLLAALLGTAALAGAMLITVADVVLRQLGGAVAGVVDLVQLAIMAAAFLAIPYTFMSDGHVSVDLVAQNFSLRTMRLLHLIGAILATGLLLLMLRYGWASALQQFRFGDRSHTIGIPLLWYWSPLLAGFALSAVGTLLLAGRELITVITGRDPLERDAVS